jgi:hypothetical protein
MERESFSDPVIAKEMNERFVCVKVDREERPDVDQVYMLAVQLISGGGGWPMSVFLTPDAKPFWGGTYFPARDGDREQSVGFLTVIRQLDEAWKTKSDAVRAQSELVTEAIKKHQESLTLASDHAPPPSPTWESDVFTSLAGEFDPDHGGFGYSASNDQMPKFPEASCLLLLIDRMNRESLTPEQQAESTRMLTKTLDAMTSGAMYDHLGGGFHRYSVDRRWFIPHFEKMLYDNAQLASVYAKAFAATGNPDYRTICEGTCDFVLRELIAPRDGAQQGRPFYSSLDADSSHEEGAFYRWTNKELAELAKQVADYELFASVYGIDGKPNFEDQYFVLAPANRRSLIANELKISVPELDAKLQSVRTFMRLAREKHERPKVDTKVIAAWNGLMIAGLADAGRLLDRRDYIDAALSTVEFILANLQDDQGRILHCLATEQRSIPGYLDDHAMVVSGLIGLHRATGDTRMLVEAVRLTDITLARFWDDKRGGFFYTADDAPSILLRWKDPLDQAVPSGTSVTVENLFYLANAANRPDYQAKGMTTLQGLSQLFRQAPSGVPRLAIVAASLTHFPGQAP